MTGPECLGEAREAVEIRDGDTLIVRVDPAVPTQAVQGMQALLSANLPDGVRVVVVGCEQLAVVRGGDD